jgi:hypothetical protein
MSKLRFLFVIAVMGLAVAGSSATILRQRTYNSHAEPGAPSTARVFTSSSCSGSYLLVNVECTNDRCNLICEGSGSLCCNWSVGESYCHSCEYFVSNSGSLYTLGDVNSMIYFAEGQISSNVSSGTYSSNLVIGSLTYYRTVTWSYNTSTGERDIDVSVTEVQ